MAKQTKDIPPHVTVIKNFCKLLSGYSVAEVIASYDGSGESGCLDVMFRVTPATRQTPGPRPVLTSSMSNWRRSEEFFKPILDAKDPLITQEKINEFEDALYNMLPDGWEIDDGSYGEITVDMSDFTVRIEHNERVTEVNSSSAEY